jgi:hypothetical protein
MRSPGETAPLHDGDEGPQLPQLDIAPAFACVSDAPVRSEARRMAAFKRCDVQAFR